MQLKNPRGYTLKCSHWEPEDSQRPSPKLPCVVYVHGNAGCRLDGSEYAPLLLSTYGITLFTLDLSGCGLSEGLRIIHL